MEVTVDSGACDTVMPVSRCSFKILPLDQPQNDMEYEVANGASIGGAQVHHSYSRQFGRKESHVPSCGRPQSIA